MRKYLEQRRYKRRPVNLNAEISVEVKKWDKAKKYLLPVKVINLSLQGCCFITHTVLLNGKHLFLENIGSEEIEIQIYLPKNLIKTLAKVIWFDYAEEYKGFKVGLSFEFMKDSNLNFLKQYLSLKDSALKKIDVVPCVNAESSVALAQYIMRNAFTDLPVDRQGRSM